jgi:hypothetical protein
MLDWDYSSFGALRLGLGYARRPVIKELENRRTELFSVLPLKNNTNYLQRTSREGLLRFLSYFPAAFDIRTYLRFFDLVSMTVFEFHIFYLLFCT